MYHFRDDQRKELLKKHFFIALPQAVQRSILLFLTAKECLCTLQPICSLTRVMVTRNDQVWKTMYERALRHSRLAGCITSVKAFMNRIDSESRRKTWKNRYKRLQRIKLERLGCLSFFMSKILPKWDDSLALAICALGSDVQVKPFLSSGLTRHFTIEGHLWAMRSSIIRVYFESMQEKEEEVKARGGDVPILPFRSRGDVARMRERLKERSIDFDQIKRVFGRPTNRQAYRPLDFVFVKLVDMLALILHCDGDFISAARVCKKYLNSSTSPPYKHELNWLADRRLSAYESISIIAREKNRISNPPPDAKVFVERGRMYIMQEAKDDASRRLPSPSWKYLSRRAIHDFLKTPTENEEEDE
mmetsp:Transcript_45805/g.73667  ORF Transcript_45805/g.73667 Transcript_45805/m.73667 type:complete len:360 (+) Transcript_45805:443-1522(+)